MTATHLIPTIGLEVHLHLATRTKLFCACRVQYDAPPNSRCCPVCLGLPGVLPVMNERAVELAVRMALALNCTVPDLAKWDRKHYYYPDLPKNYQISEYDQPLGVGGWLDIPVAGGAKRIGITRVHLEEDAGKLLHAEDGSNTSVVDLNRTGTPLLEVVSEPDLSSPEEVRAYGEALRQIAVYLGVGGCNMQLGQMRFEPNISLRIGTGPDGRPRYTPIAEIKNLNSFRSVERAVAYEIARHRDQYEADPAGYRLERLGKETRGWLDDKEVTFLQRSKEEAHDYRYFPEPDLVPFVPDRAWVEKVRASVPELPDARRRRFIRDYGLPEYDAGVLTADRQVADYFEALAAIVKDPKAASNWVMQDVMRVLNERRIGGGEFPIAPPALAELVGLVKAGAINRSTAGEVFARMLASGRSARRIVEEENLAQVADAGALDALVEQVIAANERTAADYRAGKKAAIGRLIGEAMKASGGKANPQLVRQLLERKLGG
jgi:aspartyl-tRNA(Asn)/glutamyl-tRNA(Gln) amidotransferase subunit B